jgi:hypothetical protein
MPVDLSTVLTINAFTMNMLPYFPDQCWSS